jgi:hypothetical protein
MSTSPDDRYTGEGPTIEDAVTNAVKQVPKTVQHEPFQVTIYADVSGNPIHGYIVALTPGSP